MSGAQASDEPDYGTRRLALPSDMASAIGGERATWLHERGVVDLYGEDELRQSNEIFRRTWGWPSRWVAFAGNAASDTFFFDLEDDCRRVFKAQFGDHWRPELVGENVDDWLLREEIAHAEDGGECRADLSQLRQGLPALGRLVPDHLQALESDSDRRFVPASNSAEAWITASQIVSGILLLVALAMALGWLPGGWLGAGISLLVVFAPGGSWSWWISRHDEHYLPDPDTAKYAMVEGNID